MPTRAEVAAFLGGFAKSNGAIRARWFPQRRSLFDVDLGRYPADASPVVLGPDEIISMFVRVLLKDQELGFGMTPEALRRT
jgi:hypothetical protein